MGKDYRRPRVGDLVRGSSSALLIVGAVLPGRPCPRGCGNHRCRPFLAVPVSGGPVVASRTCEVELPPLPPVGADSGNLPCPGCGARAGRIHGYSCAVDRCGTCGGRAWSCGHPREPGPWDGAWPGRREAAALGWFVRPRGPARRPGPDGFVPCGAGEAGAGPAPGNAGWWVRCGAGEDGAVPDLNGWEAAVADAVRACGKESAPPRGLLTVPGRERTRAP